MALMFLREVKLSAKPLLCFAAAAPHSLEGLLFFPPAATLFWIDFLGRSFPITSVAFLIMVSTMRASRTAWFVFNRWCLVASRLDSAVTFRMGCPPSTYNPSWPRKERQSDGGKVGMDEAEDRTRQPKRGGHSATRSQARAAWQPSERAR